MSVKQPRVLFVCAGNAGRSQMAQALFSRMAGERVIVKSAGVAPWDHLHPVAVRLITERGLTMQGRCPKHVAGMTHEQFDFVVTLGDNARDETPDLPGNPRRIHWDIADPADADGTPRQETVFRQTLALIEERLPGLLDMIRGCETARQLHLEPGISTCFVRPNRFDPARSAASWNP